MNCLINKQGKVVECQGADHEILCVRILKQRLNKFLDSGGCRVKIHFDTLAVECNQILMPIQVSIINGILRNNEIYQIVSQIKGIPAEQQSFRCIRGLVV